MAFEKILQEVFQTAPGACSAVVMTLDGLVVAQQGEKTAGIDAEAVLVELLAALKAARQAAGQIEGGKLKDMALDLGRVSVVLRPLGEEHFAALLFPAEAVAARGRFALRLKAMDLVRELS